MSKAIRGGRLTIPPPGSLIRYLISPILQDDWLNPLINNSKPHKDLINENPIGSVLVNPSQQPQIASYPYPQFPSLRFYNATEWSHSCNIQQTLCYWNKHPVTSIMSQFVQSITSAPIADENSAFNCPVDLQNASLKTFVSVNPSSEGYFQCICTIAILSQYFPTSWTYFPYFTR